MTDWGFCPLLQAGLGAGAGPGTQDPAVNEQLNKDPWYCTGEAASPVHHCSTSPGGDRVRDVMGWGSAAGWITHQHVGRSSMGGVCRVALARGSPLPC